MSYERASILLLVPPPLCLFSVWEEAGGHATLISGDDNGKTLERPSRFCLDEVSAAATDRLISGEAQLALVRSSFFCYFFSLP